jgi:sugar lactone lactonase YvrE
MGPPPVVTLPGTQPPQEPSPYRGMIPHPGKPSPIGNTDIFDDTCGLVWDQAHQQLLFSVCQLNRILSWVPNVPDKDNFKEVRPGGENVDGIIGIDLGPRGSLWACEQRTGNPHRISRSIDGYDHPVTVVDSWQDPSSTSPSALNSPWFLTVRWDGNVYFTDTPHQYSSAIKHLFRIDPSGTLSVIKTYTNQDSEHSEGGPIGIALSRDHNSLYISTWNHPGYPQLVRFDLNADGSVDKNADGTTKDDLFMTDEQGPIQASDGLCVDQADNIYMAATGSATDGGGVRIYSPTGDSLGVIDVPGATDCTFGGADLKTLLVAAGGGVAGDKNLYQVPMNIPGVP